MSDFLKRLLIAAHDRNKGLSAKKPNAAVTPAQVEQLLSMRSFDDFQKLDGEYQTRLASGSASATGIPGIGSIEAAIISIKMAFFQSMNDTAVSNYDDIIAKRYTDRESEDLIVADGAPNMVEWKGDRRHSTFKQMKYRIETANFVNGLILNSKAARRNGPIIAAIIEQASKMGIAAKWRYNALCGQRLIEAFPGSTKLAFTDKTLCATDHSVFDGPSIDNYMGAVAFNAANVDLAIAKLGLIKSYDGSRLQGRDATHCLVGPQNHAAAVRMFAAQNASGGTDAYLAGRCKVIKISELGNQWFIGDFNAGKPLVYLETQGVEFSEDRSAEHDNNTVKIGADAAFAVEPNDFTCIVGANPA